MSSNLREFDLGVKEYAEKQVPSMMRDFRDAVALEGLRGMVMLSPVLTGRLRGNHQVTVGTPADGEVEVEDPSGGPTIAKGAAVIASATDPFDPIWIHNGVPYAGHVNDGTENQPAVHMLERTADRLRRAFRVWGGG